MKMAPELYYDPYDYGIHDDPHPVWSDAVNSKAIRRGTARHQCSPAFYAALVLALAIRREGHRYQPVETGDQ